jgi:protoporphyrin/coproporphyrin ferrochelatase
MSSREAQVGVILMTYGSPDGPDDMARYLAAVRGGRPPTDEVIVEFRRRYAAIGGSPLIPITQAQAAALEQRLRADGIEARVVAGMRFSEPGIAAGLAELAEAGCGSVVGIIMSPQYSGLLMSGYRRALEEAAAALGDRAPAISLAPTWYRQAPFVDAVATRILEGLGRLPPDERDRAPVLLTAHSLPRRVAEMEPEYLDQLRETAELVAARGGLAAARWRFCWQSAGHEPGEWMKPDFADLLPELRDEGHRSVLVAPIQFLADHLEVLYDIDIGARAQADEFEMAFARIESLNVMPAFMDALANVVRDAIAEPVPVS